MSLTREDWVAVVADARARAKQLNDVADTLEQLYLGRAPVPAAAIGAAVVAEARKPRAALPAKPPAEPTPPPTDATPKKAGPKPKAASASAEPEHQAPATGDAAALKSLRQSLGMSQVMVGEIAGYKGHGRQMPISRMENGQQQIPAGLLDKLRQVLRDKKLGDRGKVAL